MCELVEYTVDVSLSASNQKGHKNIQACIVTNFFFLIQKQ
jgi:hypothetical protein